MLAFLFAAISVGPQGAPLRSGCGLDDAVVAVLPPARAVELRFALNDGSGCYKVATTLNGELVEGYIRGPLLDGLAEFERELRNAPNASGVRILNPDSPPKIHPIKKVQAPLEPEDRSEATTDKLFGLRVLLKYEAGAVQPDIARNLVSVLDQEVIRVSDELGCSPHERLTAILQSRPNYLKSTGAAEWSSGLYDGRIHVAMPDNPGGLAEVRQILTHEVVHACLTVLSPNWPAWLQEGIAQKLSGATPSEPMLTLIRQLTASHSLPKLENLAQSWSRMSAQHARLAYTLSLVAAGLLWENYAAYGLRNILNNPAQLPRITADLDRRLGL